MVAKLREAYERALELPEAEQERLARVLGRAMNAVGVDACAEDDLDEDRSRTLDERRAAAEELVRLMDKYPVSPDPAWKFNREEIYTEQYGDRLWRWR